MIDLATIAPFVPVVLALGSAAGSVRFIQESQRGVKLRFGKVIRNRNGKPRIYEPGFVLTLPTVHHLRRIHVRTQTLALEPQRVMLADRTVFQIGALVITHVMDDVDAIYQSLFEVDDVAASVEEFSAATLRDVLAGCRYEDLDHPDRLANAVRERLIPRLHSWGTEVDDVKLTDCSPSPETSRMVLIQAEAQMRVQALLTTAAAVGSLPSSLSPTLAAALIGAPVTVTLSESQDEAKIRTATPEHPNFSQHVTLFGGRHQDPDEAVGR